MVDDYRLWRALLLVLPFLLPAGLRADAPKGGWARAESELKRAVVTGQVEKAKAVIQELARANEPAGVRLIIQHALRAKDYQVYSFATGALVTFKDPAIRSEVYTALRKNRSSKTRIMLLAVVKRWAEDPKAIEALHRRISDSRKEVVFAALRWIRELKIPEKSMDPLIAELERREKKAPDRVYYDIKRTLTHLTGHDFDIAADWKNYWVARKSNLRVVPKRSGQGRTRVDGVPEFFSIKVDSSRVMFLIDVSGSMAVQDTVYTSDNASEPPNAKRETKGRTVVDDGTRRSGGGGETTDRKSRVRSRISAVKEELIRTLRLLPRSVHFNIISFNHELVFCKPGPGLLQATQGNKSSAVRWVQGLQPSGLTRTDLALYEALRTVDVDTIYLLTDGLPKKIGKTVARGTEVTAQGENIPTESILAMVREANRFRKCRINTIGFRIGTLRRGRTFLQALAKENDGRCVLLE